jgi:mono/diheme cytochrome c family protein
MQRTRLFAWLGLLIFGFLSAACTPDKNGIFVKGTRFNDEQLAQGRALYEGICAACHGIDGQGQFPDAPLVPDATGRYGAPPHNEVGHTWHHTDELLVRYVIEGGFADEKRFYQMPSLGAALTREQAMMIIAYIKTMWSDEQRTYQQHMTEEEERQVAQTQP